MKRNPRNDSKNLLFQESLLFFMRPWSLARNILMIRRYRYPSPKPRMAFPKWVRTVLGRKLTKKWLGRTLQAAESKQYNLYDSSPSRAMRYRHHIAQARFVFRKNRKFAIKIEVRNLNKSPFVLDQYVYDLDGNLIQSVRFLRKDSKTVTKRFDPKTGRKIRHNVFRNDAVP